MSYRFADPWFLSLLLILPLILVWTLRRAGRRNSSLRFPHVGSLKKAYKPMAARSRHFLFALRLIALGLLVLAAARPQSGATREEVTAEGIDIVLALDLSTSMLAQDIEPDRIEAAKQVAADFVRRRTNDRIGLVVFAGHGFVQCPLTLDYGILLDFLDELKVGLLDDGTALGMGIATAVGRLKESEAESKVLILLTDGRNNAGEIDPATAAQMAQAFGIRIYSIGAGTRGVAPYPVDDPVFGRRQTRIRVDIDEEALRQAADTTGGRYFRATDRESLEEIYREIDELEKSEIKVNQYTQYGELFPYPLALAVVILLGELGLSGTWFRKIP